MKSIVRYPERGAGGKNTYRGNCSPKLIEDLISHFQVKEICDYMAGSYTTQDAATKMGIPSHCYDLNHGFDLLDMDIPERSEFIFWHPPYWDIVKYSDEQYSAKEVIEKYGLDPRVHDLSRTKTWEEFIKLQNYCTMKQYAALEKGGRLAILMGDIKKKGRLYSQLLEIVKPGTIENIVIKEQFNCWSDQNTYSGKFIPICHEYLLILRKDMPLIIPYQMNVKMETDIRDMRSSTWKQILIEVMQKVHKPMKLEELYDMIEGHQRSQENTFWREKIRQTLQRHDEFVNVSRGIWKLAS